MADEPAVVTEPVVASVAESVVAAPVVAPVAEPITSEYSFDTWRQGLGEDIRDEKSLLSFKNAKDKDELTALMAKSFVMTKKMVGANVVAIPTDASTEGEWQEYHKAGGRPETVADYNLKTPDDFPQEIADQIFPSDRLSKWQDRFFKGGVSKKAADQFVADFANDMLADYKDIQITKEQAMTDLKSGLTADWGAAFEQNKHRGDMAITEGANGDFEFQQRISEKFGSDPDFVRFTANLGAKFAEGKPPGYDAIPSTSDMQDQIDTLMADPLYLNGTTKQRMNIANKIMAIREKMKPEPATT